MKLIKIFIIILMIFSTGCSNEKTAITNEIKKDFTKAINAYQEIWQTKDLNNAHKLANAAFTNEEIIEQVLASYKANVENDHGINIIEKKYDVSVISINENKAILKVRATLKGYPISISTGHKKIIKIQDLSFGPHKFEMKKEQGTWKISKF